jgi:hypothetical protein
VAVGGTYPDVVQAFQEAKAGGALPGRFEVDAVPETGRAYDRPAQAEPHADAEKSGAAPPSGKDPSPDGDQGGWKTAGTPAPADKTTAK